MPLQADRRQKERDHTKARCQIEKQSLTRRRLRDLRGERRHAADHQLRIGLGNDAECVANDRALRARLHAQGDGTDRNGVCASGVQTIGRVDVRRKSLYFTSRTMPTIGIRTRRPREWLHASSNHGRAPSEPAHQGGTDVR